MVAPLQGCSQEDQRDHAVTCRQDRLGPGRALAADRAGLAPAGVRLLTVGGPHPDPLDPRPEPGRRAGDGEEPGTADQPRPDRAGTRPPRVLLVDDSPAMRRVLRGLLEDAGIPVVGEAVDGAHGVELAVALRPDVVLMDWRMPHLDGLAATARIRQQLPEVQVVMFSSAEGVGGGTLARQAGASAFVAKGSPPEQLCAAVLAAWRPPAPGPS